MRLSHDCILELICDGDTNSPIERLLIVLAYLLALTLKGESIGQRADVLRALEAKAVAMSCQAREVWRDNVGFISAEQTESIAYQLLDTVNNEGYKGEMIGDCDQYTD